jgi:hypothetical protein
VLFAADGTARLIDLTSARPLDAPAAVTTAAYALPGGSRVSAREADCFALGALLFELSTARLPFGPAGPTGGRLDPAAAAVRHAEGGPLLAAAATALRAGGRVEGLSYFTDVIESVREIG